MPPTSIRQRRITRGYIAELLQSIVDSSSGIVTKKQPARPSKRSAFVPSNDPLTQDAYWKAIQGFLRPGDVIIAEDGASSAEWGDSRCPTTAPISQALLSGV